MKFAVHLFLSKDFYFPVSHLGLMYVIIAAIHIQYSFVVFGILDYFYHFYLTDFFSFKAISPLLLYLKFPVCYSETTFLVYPYL